MWMEDLDCDRGGWDGGGGMRDGESSSMELLFSFGILIGWRKDVLLQRGFVYLGIHKLSPVNDISAERT